MGRAEVGAQVGSSIGAYKRERLLYRIASHRADDGGEQVLALHAVHEVAQHLLRHLSHVHVYWSREGGGGEVRVIVRSPCVQCTLPCLPVEVAYLLPLRLGQLHAGVCLEGVDPGHQAIEGL